MTGHDMQRRAVRAAPDGDPDAIAAMAGHEGRGAIIDESVAGSHRAILEQLGATVVVKPKPEPRPSLGWRAPWQAVLKAAIRWAGGRYGDDSVATGEAMRICAAHGWKLDHPRAYRLILATRTTRKARAA